MVAVRVGELALRLAIVAAIVATAGWRRPRVGRPALVASALGLAVAVGCLAEAFWSHDYSLAYVADHARRDAGTATRLSGLWGGMAGSLLVFALGTAVAAAVAAGRAPARLQGAVAAVGAAVTGALALIVVAFADPFARLEIPAVDGAGLTPILEHPAMLYHPPLVYAGLTSLTAAFALTVAALAREGLDEDWAARVRRWLLVPWTLLAVGMLAGAHWAYVELGWGGYWAWDPVENTALLPWLAVTAALHARQGRARRAVAAWVGGAFLLALLGGLLTRSGSTASVHAFAEERTIGRALAVVLLGATVAVVALVRRARPHPAAGPAALWPPSRSGAVRVQPWLVGAVLAVVLLGSLWPLTAELRDSRPLTVEGTYFAALAGPLAIALLALMAVGPSLGRGRPGPAALAAALGAAAGVTLAARAGWHGAFALAAAAAGGAAVVGAGRALALAGRSRPRGGHLAHLGVALFLLGVAGTTTGATDTVSLAEGQSTEVHGLTVTNRGVRVVATARPDTQAVEAQVVVDGHVHHPQLVAHTTRNRLLAESSLRSTPAQDVQVMLRDARDSGGVVVQVGVHPLQQLVWWGALVMVAGGGVAYRAALTPRGRRPAGAAASPAASRASPPAAGAARPAGRPSAPGASARSGPA